MLALVSKIMEYLGQLSFIQGLEKLPKLLMYTKTPYIYYIIFIKESI